MRFFEDNGAVLLNILRTVAFGAAADFLLEMINGWRIALRPNKKALFAADLAWCVFSAVGFFMLLLAYADGSLRLLWFAGAATGIFLFRRLFGVAARRVFAACFRLAAKLCGFIRSYILLPCLSSLKKAAIFFSKPLIFFARCIKMTMYRLKIGRTGRKIVRRKRKWLRKREKAERQRERC